MDLSRIGRGLRDGFDRMPWLGWALWFAFCVNTLVRTHPRRFGSTFDTYMETGRLFWSGRPLYDLTGIGGYLYWPSFPVLMRPLLGFDDTTAAMIAMTLLAVLFTAAVYALVRALLPAEQAGRALVATGVVLLCLIWSAWFNFKYVQAQIPMTAMMLLAAAAMAKQRWWIAAFCLFVAVAVKPLALVMLLLCAAVKAPMRLPGAVALLAVLALPYAVADAGYVTGQYALWFEKMKVIGAVKPVEWEMEADIASMLAGAGIVLTPFASMALRGLAALGTLAMAWRFAGTQSPRGFAIAVLILSGCYITLFGPRNETISFLVLNPGLTVLAIMLLGRDESSRTGWLLLGTALLLGIEGDFYVFGILKPAVTCVLYGWLVAMALRPERWRALTEDGNVRPPIPASQT